MSIIIIAFPGAPKPSEEASEADKQLDKVLEKLTKGCLQRFYFASNCC